jgi:hypothetical protein
VFVNDRKVHEAVLRDGDIVIFGGGGNRPIGAVLEQRDWDFKYEFRINPKWTMPTAGDDASEDDTADGETEPRDESLLFELDGIDHRTQDSMEGVVEDTGNAPENLKKRKRGWLGTGDTQASSDSREAMMAIDVDTQEASTLTSTVEWPEEPVSKKFCPIEPSSDPAPIIPYLNDIQGVMDREKKSSGKEEEEMESGPAGPHRDLRERLNAPVGDSGAQERISALQAELYAACEERRVMPAKYPYPDDSEVQCKACKNLIFSPTKMGCGHSLCDGCVECLVIESPNCPVCDKPVVTPIQLDAEMQTRVLTIVREWNQTERAEWFAHMIRRNDRIRKAGLELLLESFRAHGVRFVHIEERWSDMDRTMFSERVDMYMAAPRISFCDAVGLTSEWIQQADFDQLLTALGNVGISITPIVNRALKQHREKESSHSAVVSSDSASSSSSPTTSSSLSSIPPPRGETPPPVSASDPIFVEAFRSALLHFTLHNRRHLQVMQHQQLQQLQLLQQQQRAGPALPLPFAPAAPLPVGLPAVPGHLQVPMPPLQQNANAPAAPPVPRRRHIRPAQPHPLAAMGPQNALGAPHLPIDPNLRPRDQMANPPPPRVQLAAPRPRPYPAVPMHAPLHPENDEKDPPAPEGDEMA